MLKAFCVLISQVLLKIDPWLEIPHFKRGEAVQAVAYKAIVSLSASGIWLSVGPSQSLIHGLKGSQLKALLKPLDWLC